MDSSDTHYTQSGEVHVAYRVFGVGPLDLVFASGLDFPSVEFHDLRAPIRLEPQSAARLLLRRDRYRNIRPLDTPPP